MRPVIRVSWPVLILGIALVALVARRPSLLASRGFFPVILVIAAFVLIGFSRRSGRDR